MPRAEIVKQASPPEVVHNVPEEIVASGRIQNSAAKQGEQEAIDGFGFGFGFIFTPQNKPKTHRSNSNLSFQYRRLEVDRKELEVKQMEFDLREEFDLHEKDLEKRGKEVKLKEDEQNWLQKEKEEKQAAKKQKKQTTLLREKEKSARRKRSNKCSSSRKGKRIRLTKISCTIFILCASF